MTDAGKAVAQEVVEEVTSHVGELVVSPFSPSEETAEAFEGAALGVMSSPRRGSEAGLQRRSGTSCVTVLSRPPPPRPLLV